MKPGAFCYLYRTIYRTLFESACFRCPFPLKKCLFAPAGVMLQSKQPRTGHDQSAGPAPARWKAGSATAAMGRSIRASPADKANSQSQTAAPVPRRGVFLCSFVLNCYRSGLIRPTGGTPERRNAQKAPARLARYKRNPRRKPSSEIVFSIFPV